MPEVPARRTKTAEPLDEVRTPWRSWTPIEVTRRLKSVRTPGNQPPRWAIAGGWALDLFLGHASREHADVEIVVLNDDVPSVISAFSGPAWRWTVPHEGWLYPLESPAFDESHQTWLWSELDGAFVLDVFRDQHDEDSWICRRDPTIRMPWSTLASRSAEGIPFLLPEIVLLFKAKHARPKDVTDLLAVLPSMDSRRRAWLRTTVEQVHPGHSWQRLL